MNRQNTYCLASKALLGCALLLAGCGDSGPERNAMVQGTLTIDGDLASSGTVTFHPVDGGPVAVGTVHEDGSYSLSTGRGTMGGPNSGTVFPGKYRVTVMITGPQIETNAEEDDGPPAAGPRLVAAKFTSVETSGLEFEIKSGLNLCVLPVLGAAHDPPAEEDPKEGEADDNSAAEIPEVEESAVEESEEESIKRQARDANENEATDAPSDSDEQEAPQ